MVKIRYLLILLTFATIFYNCKSVDLYNHYSQDDLFETSHDLILYEDSTFKFEIHEGFLHDTIHGTWNVLGKRELYLTPDKLANHHIITNLDTYSDKLYIKTYAYPENNELVLPQVTVYSNGNIIYNGFCKYLGAELLQLTDSIKINYVGRLTYVYVPQISGCVLVKFFLISQQQARLQQDEIFRIKRNRIVGVGSKLELVK